MEKTIAVASEETAWVVRHATLERSVEKLLDDLYQGTEGGYGQTERRSERARHTHAHTHTHTHTDRQTDRQQTPIHSHTERERERERGGRERKRKGREVASGDRMRERSSVVTSLSHPCTEEIFAPMILLTHAYYTTPAELCNALLKWYKLRERERERPSLRSLLTSLSLSKVFLFSFSSRVCLSAVF